MPDYFYVSNRYTIKSKLSKFKQIWVRNMTVIYKKNPRIFHFIELV